MALLGPDISTGSRVRFGLFEVDLARGTLSRQGTRLKLQEQPFRILTILLQQPGEIVTREQCRQALWPEGTHVNFDGSLNAALKKLRAALQDEAENPRFIETVPRQGYRFLAPIQTINDAVASVQEGRLARLGNGDQSIEVRLHLPPDIAQGFATPPDWDRERAERTQKRFDLMLLSIAILFGSWLLFFIVYPVPYPSMQHMARITNAGRIDEWGGIVSDGTRIFFLERNDGRWNLMQTSVEGGNAEKMATPFENTRLFAISPDHSQFLIGQFTGRDEEMPLWLWPVQGGEPRRLGQATRSRSSMVAGRDADCIRAWTKFVHNPSRRHAKPAIGTCGRPSTFTGLVTRRREHPVHAGSRRVRHAIDLGNDARRQWTARNSVEDRTSFTPIRRKLDSRRQILSVLRM